MSDANQKAAELFKIYKRQYDALVNVYCQARQVNPLGRFTKLAGATWRAGLLMDLWRRVAIKNEVKKYQGE